MNEPFQRLQLARQHARFEQAIDASEFHGWTESTYRSHENGTRDLTRDVALRYSYAFGVSAGWLMFGENPPKWLNGNDKGELIRNPLRLPKINYKNAGKKDFSLAAYRRRSGVEYVIVGSGAGVSQNAFVIQVEDESMLPDFKPGEELVIDLDEPHKPGDYVLARVDRLDRAIFAKFRSLGADGDGNEMFELRPENENYPTQIIDSENPGAVIGKMVRHIRIF